MTEIDKAALEDEFVNLCRGLAKILWIAALHPHTDFARKRYWKPHFHFTKVIESLLKTKDITRSHYLKLEMHWGTLSAILGEHVPEETDMQKELEDLAQLAKDLREYLDSFLKMDLELSEAQKWLDAD